MATLNRYLCFVLFDLKILGLQSFNISNLFFNLACSKPFIVIVL